MHDPRSFSWVYLLVFIFVIRSFNPIQSSEGISLYLLHILFNGLVYFPLDISITVNRVKHKTNYTSTDPQHQILRHTSSHELIVWDISP